IIELDGDRAGSESYVTASLRVRRGDQLQQMTVWGRYIDQWSRRNGHWGLDRRLSIRDFDEIRDVTSMVEHDIGRRDRSDPSYSVLGLTREKP
ncbi:MAG: nuclear transport factor 2 family protein, partial [Tepidisphaeraceae bacterium]